MKLPKLLVSVGAVVMCCFGFVATAEFQADEAPVVLRRRGKPPRSELIRKLDNTDWNDLPSNARDGGGINTNMDTEYPFTCFSKYSTVQVLGKGDVLVKDLQVGDKVLGGSGYQTVYAFGHHNPDQYSDFLQIHTKQGNKKPLEMTPAHLVFKEGGTNPVRADSIEFGDVLVGGKTVTRVHKVQREGVFTPLTLDGTVVVDGIVASSYISLQEGAEEYLELDGTKIGMSQHDYIHLGLSPFRVFCLGVSSRLCNVYNEAGMPYYVSYSITLNKWILHEERNLVVKSVVLLLILLLTGTCRMFEIILGPTWASLGLVITGIVASVIALKKSANMKK